MFEDFINRIRPLKPLKTPILVPQREHRIVNVLIVNTCTCIVYENNSILRSNQQFPKFLRFRLK